MQLRIIMYNCFYSDVDECNNGTHNCFQICTNTNGSFTCGCKNGYQLDPDEVTCNGMYKICTYIQHTLYVYIIIITVTNMHVYNYT